MVKSIYLALVKGNKFIKNKKKKDDKKEKKRKERKKVIPIPKPCLYSNDIIGIVGVVLSNLFHVLTATKPPSI